MSGEMRHRARFGSVAPTAARLIAASPDRVIDRISATASGIVALQAGGHQPVMIEQRPLDVLGARYRPAARRSSASSRC